MYTNISRFFFLRMIGSIAMEHVFASHCMCLSPVTAGPRRGGVGVHDGLPGIIRLA